MQDRCGVKRPYAIGGGVGCWLAYGSALERKPLLASEEGIEEREKQLVKNLTKQVENERDYKKAYKKRKQWLIKKIIIKIRRRKIAC